LLREGLEFLRDGHGFVGVSGGGEEGIGGEAGAGAVGAPLMLQEALIGVDVFVGRRIGWAGGAGAVFGIGAVVVLRPEAVEDEGGVGGALGGVGMGVAELGRPGEVEEVVVEAGADGEGRALGGGRRARRRRGSGGFAGGESKECREEDHVRRRLHGGKDSIWFQVLVGQRFLILEPISGASR